MENRNLAYLIWHEFGWADLVHSVTSLFCCLMIHRYWNERSQEMYFRREATNHNTRVKMLQGWCQGICYDFRKSRSIVLRRESKAIPLMNSQSRTSGFSRYQYYKADQSLSCQKWDTRGSRKFFVSVVKNNDIWLWLSWSCILQGTGHASCNRCPAHWNGPTSCLSN